MMVLMMFILLESQTRFPLRSKLLSMNSLILSKKLGLVSVYILIISDELRKKKKEERKEESLIVNYSLTNKIQFQVYDESNTVSGAEPFSSTMGVFETESHNDTFRDFLPKIATFFMKDQNQVFLLNDKDQVLQKDSSIWEALTPFGNCRLKGPIPKLKLVLTGNMKESEILGQNFEVSLIS